MIDDLVFKIQQDGSLVAPDSQIVPLGVRHPLKEGCTLEVSVNPDLGLNYQAILYNNKGRFVSREWYDGDSGSLNVVVSWGIVEVRQGDEAGRYPPRSEDVDEVGNFDPGSAGC